MSDTEEGSIEERLREAIEEFKNLKDQDLGDKDALGDFLEKAKDTLQDLVVEAEETELVKLFKEAEELLEGAQGGKRRRNGKTKKNKSRARKTRRRLL